MNSSFLPRGVYAFLFTLLGLVCIPGLFVPLMDNDAAHHANIALRMHLSGDYVNLVDRGNDYLDKPHLHFWLAAFSYKIFGVNAFAYKLPSFLFSILGVYSTYRLGATLYNKETGKLAALLLASAFGFLLSNSDVRMDAILTACIALASWQLVLFIQHKSSWSALGAGLGLALGFSTKGPIAVFVPALAALFYLLYRREKKDWLDIKWLVLVLSFFLFISPVLYCYYLQFNLHPEKIVRGRDHINGIRFILFDQVIDRFAGRMEKETNNDHFFFLHSFIPAFAPWSLLVYLAVAGRLKNFRERTAEWATTGVFIGILLIVSFAGYQLPHYLNVVFPVSSVMTAAFFYEKHSSPKWVQAVFLIQMSVVFLVLVVTALINAWSFPVHHTGIIIGVVILLANVFYFIKSKQYTTLQRSVAVPVAAMIFLFFLLNTNFYPQLLRYQGGNELAAATKGKVDPSAVYFWDNTHSSSYNFYSHSLRQQFSRSVLKAGEKTWLIYDARDSTRIMEGGYRLGPVSFEAVDYEITKLDIRFMNPQRREKECTKMILGEISLATTD